MDSAVTGAIVVAVFVLVLAWPAVEAYRGRYRSWTYRGLGTRYGAFAVGWVAAGLFALVGGGLLREWADTAGLAIGALGLLAIAAGLVFFVWMPPFLVPRWRRELLRNSRLYRDGDPVARLNADVVAMQDSRELVVWRRAAPVSGSEWHALTVSAMHVRPRLRLAGRLRGPLPDRRTGVVSGSVTEITGELLVDGGLAVFVQAPAEDARHGDNWFAVLQRPPEPGDVTTPADGGGAVVTIGAVAGHGPLDLTVPDDADDVRRALVRSSRPRWVRHTVDGRWNRAERTVST